MNNHYKILLTAQTEAFTLTGEGISYLNKDGRGEERNKGASKGHKCCEGKYAGRKGKVCKATRSVDIFV